MHSFKSSLAKGQKGEELLLKVWPGLTRLDGRKHDFVDAAGLTYELKTDSYTTEKTANFFIELVSNIQNMKVGGPKQALNNGTTFWIYMYPASNVLYVFNTQELVDEMNKLLVSEQLALSLIPNRGYSTVGVKVPRKLLAHIYTEKRFNGY